MLVREKKNLHRIAGTAATGQRENCYVWLWVVHSIIETNIVSQKKKQSE